MPETATPIVLISIADEPTLTDPSDDPTPPPSVLLADFTFLDSGTDFEVVFTDASTVVSGGGSIDAWAWDFGDGTTSLIQNPTHLFPGAGVFEVSLLVTSADGGSDTITKRVTAATTGGAVPTVSIDGFTPASPFIGQEINVVVIASLHDSVALVATPPAASGDPFDVPLVERIGKGDIKTYDGKFTPVAGQAGSWAVDATAINTFGIVTDGPVAIEVATFIIVPPDLVISSVIPINPTTNDILKVLFHADYVNPINGAFPVREALCDLGAPSSADASVAELEENLRYKAVFPAGSLAVGDDQLLTCTLNFVNPDIAPAVVTGLVNVDDANQQPGPDITIVSITPINPATTDDIVVRVALTFDELGDPDKNQRIDVPYQVLGELGAPSNATGTTVSVSLGLYDITFASADTADDALPQVLTITVAVADPDIADSILVAEILITP